MLITDKNELKKYTAANRLWQGIPGIEVTKGGRIFLCFYSGGTGEHIGNYVLLLKSDDGINFGEPVAAVAKDEHRCFDPCLWIDTLGRLWMFWAVEPEHAVYAVVCDNPDGNELKWSGIRKIGNDVMMNKPTVLSTGEWLFPIASWKEGTLFPVCETKTAERGSFVYKSIDNGKTVEKFGGSDLKERTYDEHMILEHNDGRLAMYVRIKNGIGVSYSFDRGKTWTEGGASDLGGPGSRFFIRRLKSGRILLINHYNFTGRNNLTAMLSEDDGNTWKYKLLLDERDNVSYPDAVEAEDGYIYIVYDRERASFSKSFDETYSKAREILTAKITEQDIIEGKLVSKGSKLKQIAEKLGKYAFENTNPYGEVKRFSDAELAAELLQKYPDCIAEKIFEHYPVNCMNMRTDKIGEFDCLLEKLEKDCDKLKTLTAAVKIVRSVSENREDILPIAEAVKDVITEDFQQDFSTEEIAGKLGISKYYMMHSFKKATGTTIIEYKNSLRISHAKRLLITTDKSITDIAQECGFGSSSYFAKMFARIENVTPKEYRMMLKK